MTTVTITYKENDKAVPRAPVTLYYHDTLIDDVKGRTNQDGIVEFPDLAGDGIIYVSGQAQFKGQLEGDISISIDTPPERPSTATLRGIGGGSMAYANMQTDEVIVNGVAIETCSEGYIVNPHEWTEDYAFALAEKEGLELTDEHWEVLLYLRDYYNEKHVQCTVRDMIKHFRKVWGKEKGSNKYLHQLFLRGGPQKQGNRLAGLLRTKGEH